MRKYISAAIAVITMPCAAHAMRTQYNDFTFDLTGYGSGGMFYADEKKPDFIGDWRVRAAVAYDVNNENKLGAVYSLDEDSVDSDEYINDLFAYWQSRKLGRAELGMTDSVATKLGLGLPDVGGMRVNDTSLVYRKINPDGPVIPDTAVDSGDQLLRLNLVTPNMSGAQYGVSFATLADGYDYSADFGMKFRRGNGKLKSAFSLGGSFINRPHNYSAEKYAPNVTADWRGQLGMGANFQYNSWILGLTFRAIYDENARTQPSDGIAAGAGVSYDLLKYSVSLTYMISSVGIWHDDAPKYTDNTVIGSLRYKYSANVDGWTSVGMSTKTPFVAAGLRLTF